MRVLLIASIAAVAACGNGMVQLDQIVPFEGTLSSTLWQEQPIGSTWSHEGASHEVDTSQGFCLISDDANDERCVREPLGPHYAALLVSNHNDPPEISGVTGTVQLERYTVEIRGRSQGAPEINGFGGRLGVNIRPGLTRAFPILLVGLDSKSEFRNSNATFPHQYNVLVTLKGAGGVSIEGAITLLMGDFAKCGDGISTSFCTP